MFFLLENSTRPNREGAPVEKIFLTKIGSVSEKKMSMLNPMFLSSRYFEFLKIYGLLLVLKPQEDIFIKSFVGVS